MTTGPGSEQALRGLLTTIAQARGLDCTVYKARCLRRRLAVRLRARGVHTYDDYASVLERDPSEYDHLLDALTINVTRFYRNPETWEALTTRYLPSLWRDRRGQLRCWSAGCASGEEAYSLAVAIAEVARACGPETWVSRASIDATDIDPASIARAVAGEYPATALEEMPAALRSRYLPAPPYVVPPMLQRLVRVRQHDMTREPPPAAPYDVIVCRNTIIYFDRAAQERLFERFADALVVGGLLVLGKVETLFGAARDRFAAVEPRERVYRRAA